MREVDLAGISPPNPRRIISETQRPFARRFGTPNAANNLIRDAVGRVAARTHTDGIWVDWRARRVRGFLEGLDGNLPSLPGHTNIP